MWQYNTTNELYHHGVKGMKWGVRRYQNKDGSLTPRGEKRAIKDIKKERKNASKNRRSLSDADLKARVERLKLEKQFKDLTDSDVRPGRTAVNGILSAGGKKVATAFTAGSLALAGAAAVKKFGGSDKMAGFLFPKPKFK